MVGGEAQVNTAVINDNTAPVSLCEDINVFAMWNEEWQDELFEDRKVEVEVAKRLIHHTYTFLD